jgi:hypothetical protein
MSGTRNESKSFWVPRSRRRSKLDNILGNISSLTTQQQLCLTPQQLCPVLLLCLCAAVSSLHSPEISLTRRQNSCARADHLVRPVASIARQAVVVMAPVHAPCRRCLRSVAVRATVGRQLRKDVGADGLLGRAAALRVANITEWHAREIPSIACLLTVAAIGTRKPRIPTVDPPALRLTRRWWRRGRWW